MLRSTRFRLLAPSALAGLLVLLVATAAAAKTVPVDLRVLTVEGKVLADQRQYTGPVTIRTDQRRRLLRHRNRRQRQAGARSRAPPRSARFATRRSPTPT